MGLLFEKDVENACGLAQELNVQRVVYLNKKKLSGDHCNHFPTRLGIAVGNKIAREMIEQVVRGSPSDKSVASSFFSELKYNDDTCVKIHSNEELCKQLKNKAAEGGEKADDYASASQKPCEKVKKLTDERLAFLSKNEITEADKCDFSPTHEGTLIGERDSQRIIERIRNNTIGGKLLNLFGKN